MKCWSVNKFNKSIQIASKSCISIQFMFVFQLHGAQLHHKNNKGWRCKLQINFTTTGIQALITYLNWHFVSPHNLNTSWKEGLPHVPACQSPSHMRFKHLRVIPQHCSSIMIKRILAIWFLDGNLIEGRN